MVIIIFVKLTNTRKVLGTPQSSLWRAYSK